LYQALIEESLLGNTALQQLSVPQQDSIYWLATSPPKPNKKER
jgi:hypothetical protein